MRAIRDSGGVAVLAHPLLYKFSPAELERCVERLKDDGLQAVETFYSTYSAADERAMKRLALKYGLAFSGGSDFHGMYTRYVRPLGSTAAPDECLQALLAYKDKRRKKNA